MEPTGSNQVVQDVQKKGLCTGCGACVNLCPYFKNHRGKTVRLFACDRTWGRCYAYCPRTPTNMTELREKLFDAADLTLELGPFKGLYMTRAADAAVRKSAQHGGTVSALMKLALSEGIIDAAIMAGEKDQQVSTPEETGDPEAVDSLAQSKFVIPPIVGNFNEAAASSAKKYGVVAVPCQALALAKMRVNPGPGDEEKVQKLSLVVGLFCGWAFGWEKIRALLDREFGDKPILKMDIPPSLHKCMEVTTEDGMVCIPMDVVETCVAESCDYCLDMTCEFSDISVGAARSPEGWDVDKGWNQVIVRSEKGQQLLDLAREKGVLEFKDVPDGNLDKLKNASMNKKRYGLKKLAKKSGSEDDLIYLNCDDPVIRNIQAS